MNRRSDFIEQALRFGLYVATYSPGDGITRYRFFAGDGVYTALGLSDAQTFLAGWIYGRDYQMKGDEK